MAAPSDSCRRGTSHVPSQQRLVITAGLLAGSLTDVFTFDGVSLSAYRPANGPINSTGVLMVAGTDYGRAGYSPQLRIGGCLPPVYMWDRWHGTNLTTYCEHGHTASTAAKVTEWIGDTSVLCTIPSGVRDRMSVTASVGVAVGTQTFVFTYDGLVE